MTQQSTQLGHDDVEVLEERTLFQGFFRVNGVRVRHRLFAGGWSEPYEREVFVREDATCVLPYDPERDEVVLIEQFRAGALGRSQSPWLTELVAGINEPGEEPESVAKREALEEADLPLLALKRICHYLVSPGGSNEGVYLYCARVDAGSAGGVHGLDSENEDIRVTRWSFEQAMAGIEDGRINNAPAIMAMQWLALNRDNLRREWGRL